MEIRITSLEQIPDAVAQILKNFPHNRLWLLYGEMGSGKTTLIKEFCKQLGVTSETSSPTFSIINEYPSHTVQRVYHCDLYRLKKSQEVIDAGLGEIIHSKYPLFIEWPELAEPMLPEENVQIKILVNENNVRLLTAH